MNVGILGSGQVAKALAAGFVQTGHGVMLGTREPARLAEFAAATGGVKTGTPAEAAAYGELVVLAAKGTAAVEVLRSAGVARLAGKTVIDTTNPIADAPPVDGVLQFFTGPNESLFERLQAEAPGARLVKAFSSVGSACMFMPHFAGGRPTMFIAGNDAAAKASVALLLDQFGWDVADMGSAVAARAIEPLCMLWCIPGLRQNDWVHAFKMLR
jgi:predicted dinucleotide-binding enzyme